MPGVRLIDAAPTLSDDILLTILNDVETESRWMIPLLVVCDRAYEAFVERNRPWLEAHFIVRRVSELEVEGGKTL